MLRSTGGEISNRTGFYWDRALSTALSRRWVPKEEIFGPVLSVVRAGDLDEAMAVGDDYNTATVP